MQKSQRKVGMIFSYIKTLLLIFVNIFLTPFLVSSLGDSEYGVYQAILSFGGYLILVNFGTGAVMTRYVSIALKNKDKKSEENYIATCLLITLGLGLVILVLAVSMYFLIGSIYANSMTPQQIEKSKILYLFVAGTMFLTFFWNTFEGIISAYEKFVVNSLSHISKTVFKVIFIVILFAVTADSLIVVAVDFFLTLLILGFNIFYILFKLKVRWKLYFFDKAMVLSSVWFSLAIFLQTIINQVNTRVDVTILGVMVDMESVTRYSIAMQMFSIFASISTVAVSVYLPKFSRMCADGKPSGKVLTEAMLAPSRIQFLVSGAIMFGFLICGRDFINVWMGEKYSFAWTIAVIIMIPNFITYINAMVETVLDAMGKRLVRSIILVGIAVCNIGVSIVLVHFFGEVGAPVGTAIATLAGLVVMNIYYVKVIGFRLGYFCANVFKGLLPSLLISALVSLPFVFLLDTGFIGLLVKGGVFVVSLAVCLLIFGFNKEEKSLITGVFKRFRK